MGFGFDTQFLHKTQSNKREVDFKCQYLKLGNPLQCSWGPAGQAREDRAVQLNIVYNRMRWFHFRIVTLRGGLLGAALALTSQATVVNFTRVALAHTGTENWVILSLIWAQRVRHIVPGTVYKQSLK